MTADVAATPRLLEPTGAAALAEAVRGLGARGEAALVRGAGTELPQGNLTLRADVLLSTRGLSGIEELDAEEGVARVGAGTAVAALREAAHREGLDVPLDPPSLDSTVGGALAAAALGPRCLGYGRARDAVLGLDVVLGSGEQTRCGGRVVKNVTGYDLAKLYVGSLGTLAVITGAWLRLRPLPEAVCVLAATLAPGAAAFASALDAARLPGARAAALVDGALAAELGPGLPVPLPGGFLLVTELAADEPVVAQGAATLADRLGAVEVPASTVEAVRAVEGAAEDSARASSLRFRVTARPARLAAARTALHDAGARVLVHPGLGLLCARFEPALGDAHASVEAAFRAATAAARAGEGHAQLAAGPRSAREGREVFGDAAGLLPLLRRLREGFDPGGVLNPGRLLRGLP